MAQLKNQPKALIDLAIKLCNSTIRHATHDLKVLRKMQQVVASKPTKAASRSKGRRGTVNSRSRQIAGKHPRSALITSGLLG